MKIKPNRSARSPSQHAVRVASRYSRRFGFLQAVQQLFRPSQGVPLDQLYKDTEKFLIGQARSIHQWADPLLEMEDEGLWSWIDRIRLVLVFRGVWQTGKVRFVLLPDSQETEHDPYKDMAADLMHYVMLGGDLDPERLLRNSESYRDLDFYRALPDSFTVYRGSSGVSVEQCAAGVCWTTSREIAEWYALQTFRGGEPVLIRTRIHKSEVATVFANEYEIAVQPDATPERLEPESVKGGPFPDDAEWNGAEIGEDPA